jgi:hypothetical protein
MGVVMTSIHFGVYDMPYSWQQQLLSKKGKPLKRTKTVTRATTTGEVAEILEKRYHIMEKFFERFEDKIIGATLDALDNSLDDYLATGHLNMQPAKAAESGIQRMFKDFISLRGAERVGIPGTPTLAALKGVNHRLAHPYAKANPRRPSFRDTGFYEATFGVEVD